MRLELHRHLISPGDAVLRVVIAKAAASLRRRDAARSSPTNDRTVDRACLARATRGLPAKSRLLRPKPAGTIGQLGLPALATPAAREPLPAAVKTAVPTRVLGVSVKRGPPRGGRRCYAERVGSRGGFLSLEVWGRCKRALASGRQDRQLATQETQSFQAETPPGGWGLYGSPRQSPVSLSDVGPSFPLSCI